MLTRSTLFLLLFLRSWLVAAQPAVRFELRCSQPYATYDFLQKLSDSYPDNALKAAFAHSKYNTPANLQRIADFEQLALDYSYGFPQYPVPLKAQLQSRDVLERHLVTSATVPEFVEKSLGTVPNADLLALAATLDAFLPIYRELVFEPNQAALETQRRRLQQDVDSQSFATFFAVGLRFYGSAWDNRIPFQLNLLPSLDEENMGARAFFNVAVCEVPLQLKNHTELFGVALHEVYHILYDNQSLVQKQQLKQWFTNTQSANSAYALLLLNEVLATALGNGYLPEQLNGRPDAGAWYANPYVSEMARAIYPLVKQYAAARRPLDEAFVAAYVQTYDTQFPQWNAELPHLLAYRYVVADSPADWRQLAKSYPKAFHKRLSAPVTAATLADAQASPFTKVFIFSEQHKQKLRLLAQAFPGLPLRQLNPHQEFARAFTLPDHTKLLILNRHKLSVPELLSRAFPERKLP